MAQILPTIKSCLSSDGTVILYLVRANSETHAGPFTWKTCKVETARDYQPRSADHTCWKLVLTAQDIEVVDAFKVRRAAQNRTGRHSYCRGASFLISAEFAGNFELERVYWEEMRQSLEESGRNQSYCSGCTLPPRAN
mmetsp:Transcript_23939/g.37506  ORF Transcript_23939/g.37506 Transcript_23939/m.37506 type:complete len:138 (+) Transcript_23939:658-1071(+)